MFDEMDYGLKLGTPGLSKGMNRTKEKKPYLFLHMPLVVEKCALLSSQPYLLSHLHRMRQRPPYDQRELSGVLWLQEDE